MHVEAVYRPGLSYLRPIFLAVVIVRHSTSFGTRRGCVHKEALVRLELSLRKAANEKASVLVCVRMCK